MYSPIAHREYLASNEGMRHSGQGLAIFTGVLVFALLKPVGFDEISALTPLGKLLTAFQALAFVYAIYLYLPCRISSMMGFLAAYLCCCVVGAVASGNDLALDSSQFMTFLKIISLCMLVEAFIFRGALRDLLKGILLACTLALALNLLITFAWNPQGMYSSFGDDVYANCFLGNKNTVRNPLFLGLAAALLLDYAKGVKFSFFSGMYLIVCTANMLLMQSSTSLSVFLVSCFLLVLLLKFGKSVPAKCYGVLTAITAISVIFVRKLDFFQSFVVEFLHKDMTFSGRTSIWDSAINSILCSPVFGNGLGAEVVYSNLNNPILVVNHAHDAFIDIAMRGGLISLISLLILIVAALIALDSNRKRETSLILTVIFSAFLFAGIFGELWNFCFYGVFAMTLKSGEVFECLRKERSETR